MFTRKQYMDGGCTHEQYYLDIASEIGLDMTGSPLIERLNLSGLTEWDMHGASLMTHNGSTVRAAFKARGDSVSLAGLVCLLKAAARKAATNA